MTAHDHEAKKVAGISSVLALVGTVVTGFVFIDDRYAHAGEVAKVEQSTFQMVRGLQVRMIINDLNAITVKEQFSELTKYDVIHKEQLERELQILSEGHR